MAASFDRELYAKKKLESGASAFLTQPVHSPEALENLKRARQELDCKLLGGLMPIVSYRNALYLTGKMASAYIAGMQDEHNYDGTLLTTDERGDRIRTGAVLKHFYANNQEYRRGACP